MFATRAPSGFVPCFAWNYAEILLGRATDASAKSTDGAGPLTQVNKGIIWIVVSYCIIHDWCIGYEMEKRSPDSPAYQRAHAAQQRINAIREQCIDVVDIQHGNPRKAARRFSPGDTIILCGAYRGACLHAAKEALEAKGIKVLFDRTGSIAMSKDLTDDVPDEEFHEE
jgi:hypothetical protein